MNLRAMSHVGMLSRKEAIEYLKIARRNEVRHQNVIEGFEDIAKGGKERNLHISGDFLDRLLEEEMKDRRRVAMAKKIQRVFRAVVANPEYQMCKRRLLREYDELTYRFS